MKTLTIDTRFFKGKHHGKTVAEVCMVDPDYINWLIVKKADVLFDWSTIRILENMNSNYLLSSEARQALEDKYRVQAELDMEEYFEEQDQAFSEDSFYGSNYDENLDLDQQSIEFWNNIE